MRRLFVAAHSVDSKRAHTDNIKIAAESDSEALTLCIHWVDAQMRLQGAP